ncbi:hypothetical protein GCM10010151_49450 [Actinoallomurus spadix]|uniref:Uncharacterized protein n=1 Tax=Actinoallomurus spadix TaxID=79912 RepID=A0ABP3GXA7_9ACTN
MADRPPPDAIARLRRSIDRFHAALRAAPYGGVSSIAELAWLNVLIAKYPNEARRMISDATQRNSAR